MIKQKIIDFLFLFDLFFLSHEEIRIWRDWIEEGASS